MIKKISYRAEIDGLRAIAVLAVIIFHAGIEQLSGGFIGVDIFYVISGYLITNIIITSVKNQQFSYRSFYARRAKRLLPAALTMILVTVVFAAFILSPEKYYQLAKSAEFSSLFMANVWFMKNSGYFDLSTQISPLVHMWSLSIEEQFYFFYPFIVLTAYKIGKIRGIFWSIVIIILSTFVLNLSLINTHPNFTFYMLPTRAWELGLGALIHFIPSLKTKQKTLVNVLSFTGLAGIFYSLFFITEHDAYPGYLALIPTLATAFIIYSLYQQHTSISRLLASKPLVFIGNISYSSYLWHWPIIVFYRIYINERAFNTIEISILILISLIAGYLSWRFIENRYRYQEYSDKKILKVTAYATGISVLLIASVLLTRGFPIRVTDDLAAVSNNKLMRALPCIEQISPLAGIDEKFCVVGSPWADAKYKGIVWGDSHSLHWGQILHQVAKQQDISLVIAPRKCPAYLNSAYIKSHYPKYPKFNENCTFRNNATLNWLKEDHSIELVILASAWSGQVRMHYTDEYQENLSNTSLENKFPEIGANLSKVAFEPLLAQLSDRKVLLLSDIPRPNKNLNECAFAQNTQLLRQQCNPERFKILDASKTHKWHKSSDKMIKEVANKFNNVSAIIPTELLCGPEFCQTYINNELIYRDDNHIRSNLKEATVNELARKLSITAFFENLTKH
jgi:peptidoglycan/LPS O-acetylase OafA/YrhL